MTEKVWVPLAMICPKGDDAAAALSWCRGLVSPTYEANCRIASSLNAISLEKRSPTRMPSGPPRALAIDRLEDRLVGRDQLQSIAVKMHDLAVEAAGQTAVPDGL